MSRVVQSLVTVDAGQERKLLNFALSLGHSSLGIELLATLRGIELDAELGIERLGTLLRIELGDSFRIELTAQVAKQSNHECHQAS